MTLDEAIKHCLEVAEENDLAAETYELLAENNHNAYEKLTAETNSSRCAECATEHRQLAEWLTELKEAKRLLKAAVEDVRYCMRSYDPCEICALLGEDGECPTVDDNDCSEKYKWRCEAEALTLLGKDANVPASADGANVGHKSGGWISCKDRMPEVNEPVLFIFNTESGFKTVMYGWHETIKGLGSGWHQAGVGGARADEEVTYWQPLPEPPKDGDTNG